MLIIFIIFLSNAFMHSIVIPTLNEAGNIFELISALKKAIHKRNVEIIVVDDLSDDETVKEVLKAKSMLSDSRFKVKLIVNRRRIGLSGSVFKGILASKGDRIIVMDADFQHPVDVVPKLMKAKCTVAIATRRDFDVSFVRYILYIITRLLFTLGLFLNNAPIVSDPSSGFFAFDRSILSRVERKRIVFNGWKILYDMLKQLPRNTRICEIPYTFVGRKHGTSKISMAAFISGFKSLLS